MAGTISESLTCDVAPVKVVTFTCTADSSDGSYPATTVSTNIKGRLLQIVTDPSGDTAPQDNYDITITESGGADMLLGVAANRDTANTEVAIVESNGAHSVVAETDSLTLNITNNNVNSAIIVIKLYWSEGV
jgi:cyclophilin family peptidyl-prolyl cis-trans isomerase